MYPTGKKRRFLAATAVSATVVLALGACAGGGAAPTANTRGDITMWISNNESEIAWGKQMVDAWNADHPEEQVTAQEIPAGKSSEEVIGAAITAGNAPCLVFNTAPVAVPQFEKQGGLVDLSTFPDGASYIQERSGDTAAQYQNADGKYFQMPWKANPVMIFYNKDVFTKAGLDAENPKLGTYEEFLTAARAVVKSGAAENAIHPAPTSEFFQSWFDFYPLYAAETGGKQLIEDGKATFADADGEKVAEFWKTMYDEGLAGKEQYQGDAFVDGQAAMAIVGPWAVSVYKDAVNWGVVPVPTSTATPEGETFTFSDAKNVGLYTACKNKDTAWDVLKFATSQEQDGQLLELTGQMPLRQDLTGTYPDFFAANPAYEKFGVQASKTVEVPSVSNAVAGWQAFRDSYAKAVIFGDGDISSALKTAAEKINALIAKG